jgi:hypothetical protein
VVEQPSADSPPDPGQIGGKLAEQNARHRVRRLAGADRARQGGGNNGSRRQAVIADDNKARFTPPDERLRHRAGLTDLLDGFFTWAETTERKLSRKSALAEALRYAFTRRVALSRFATDARLEADNNITENSIRGIAVGRRNWLFAGSDEGGDRAAIVITVLQTAKLNGINPQTYLTDVLTKITDGHPASRINEILPWAIDQKS